MSFMGHREGGVGVSGTYADTLAMLQAWGEGGGRRGEQSRQEGAARVRTLVAAPLRPPPSTLHGRAALHALAGGMYL